VPDATGTVLRAVRAVREALRRAGRQAPRSRNKLKPVQERAPAGAHPTQIALKPLFIKIQCRDLLQISDMKQPRIPKHLIPLDSSSAAYFLL
jgi:hypothetical protein